MKKCSKCSIEKQLNEFPPRGLVCKKCKAGQSATWRAANPERNKNNKDRWYQENKDRIVPELKEARKINPDRFKNYDLKKRFKLSIEQFYKLLESQNNSCASCKISNPGGKYNQWEVDHNHSCCPGRNSCGQCIRGLLCHGCNTALGAINDDSLKLKKLVEYLENNKK